MNTVLNVRPIGVKSVSFVRNTVRGGKSTVGTVTLELAAAPSDIAVTFSSSNPAVVPAPAGITIPAGQQTGSFTVSTGTVTATTPVIITVTANGISKNIKLIIVSP